ncbi:MAG: CBS domain-containing protein [Chloroflexi bacterium]|nr:MAG: CBS domain-containing protein [Chloroflexota bacterium]
MKIKDIMTSDPHVVSPNETVSHAAKLMKELNVGSLPVCDGSRLVGMITDRDITTRSTAQGSNPQNIMVSEVMTPKIRYCFEDQDISEAARLMQDEQIRRLPVLDRQKQLVGILSLGDLSVDADMDTLSGKTLEEISKPSRPNRQ